MRKILSIALVVLLFVVQGLYDVDVGVVVGRVKLYKGQFGTG